MNIYLRLFIFLCFFCFTAIVFATGIECVEGCEEDNILPKWTNGFSWDPPESQSFITVVSGSGWDIQAAEEQAYKNIGQAAVDHIRKECISRDQLTCNETVNRVVAWKPPLRKVTIKRVKNISREGSSYEYTVYLLVQISKKPAAEKQYDKVYDSDQYPFSGRVFVPGMAQIYKGQNVKGGLFIGGEVLFIGGIATSFGMSSYYKSKRNTTHDSGQKQSYSNWANYAGYAGWAFVGAAAALYIANIIDGIVSPGKPALFDKNGKKIVFAPTATFDSVGLAMNFNF